MNIKKVQSKIPSNLNSLVSPNKFRTFSQHKSFNKEFNNEDIFSLKNLIILQN